MNVSLPTPSKPPIRHESLREKSQRQSWNARFWGACRGVKIGIRGDASFFVHFFFVALVVAAAIVLNCGRQEWCLLLGCIGMVLSAKLFHTAFDRSCLELDGLARARLRPCRDVAAGAMLLACLTAAVVGTIILACRLLDTFTSTPQSP